MKLLASILSSLTHHHILSSSLTFNPSSAIRMTVCTMTSSDDLPAPPNKRICTSRTESPPPKKPIPDIQSILQLPEDVVWSLRKHDLRQYFLELQKYARHPYPVGSLVPQETRPTPHASNQPPFLRLPLEIRESIYNYLL